MSTAPARACGGAPSGAPPAAAPYMGWSTYYGIGGRFDEATIMEAAEALVRRGLARAGYTIVWLDWGWAGGARDARGELVIDAAQWPRGLRRLTDELHARGLLAGIYTDAGPSGCEGQGVGSHGHCAQDARAFAQWGFDAVKIDCCGAGQSRLDPEVACGELVAAIRAQERGRRMLVSICNFWRPGQVGDGYPPPERSAHATHRWASRIAESWRTDTDIGFTGRVAFADVLRNLDANDAHPESAGPGRFSDPDCLAPELGLSEDEARAQLTMWAIAAAPLVIGSDVRALSDGTVAMLAHPGVIAVDQDPLCIQGRPIRRDAGHEAWVKPLADGGCAVALLNRRERAARVAVDAEELGVSASALGGARDVWGDAGTRAPRRRHGLLGRRPGRALHPPRQPRPARGICADLPAHGAALFRLPAPA